MRKLALLASLLAIALVVSAPAMAQSVSSQVVRSTGGNVACSVATHNGQTMVRVSGLVNGVQVSDTIPLAGPHVSVDCQQLLQQAAAQQAAAAKAGNTAEAKAAPAAAVTKAEAKAAPAPATKAQQQVPELPKTGGGAIPLWGLGAGILLVAGGLLARRIIW